MEQDKSNFMILLKLDATFNLAKAVCNHGFFMLPPNNWIPSHQTLQRPIRLSNDSSCMVSIFQSKPLDTNSSYLYVRVHQVSQLPLKYQHEILEQVQRMLRISEEDEDDVRAFQQLHPLAKQSGFGRIIRSPSLFEDVVKSILLCGCRWKRTMIMADSLCDLECELKPATKSKRKRSGTSDVTQQTLRNFPSSGQLACLDTNTLNKHCQLGYRANYVIGFAKAVDQGEFDIKRLEEMASSARQGKSGSYSEVEIELKKIKGAGSFVVANLAMCLGFYHQVPIDSETKRHLRQVHGKEIGKKCEKDVEEIYSKYKPYQSLAYWLELIDWYEKALGSKLSQLPSSKYALVAGNCSSRPSSTFKN
ncbi:hypothetical protein QQ045_010601 [Rhodiola kirilowii]